jgi:hypothetical protein
VVRMTRQSAYIGAARDVLISIALAIGTSAISVLFWWPFVLLVVYMVTR